MVATRAVIGRPGRWLRGFSGLLAGGMVVLSVALIAAWFVATRMGTAGPGPDTLIWHGAGAVAAVLVQRYADRHAGVAGATAALAVVAITAAVLAVQWLF